MSVTVVCQRCGSIRIARARSRITDRLIAALTGLRPFACRRCGLRMRGRWTQPDLDVSARSRVSPHVRSEPALKIDVSPEWHRASEVDLKGLDARIASTDPLEARHRPESRRRRGRGTKRLRRRSRRDLFGAIAVTAVVTVVAAMLFLAGSCGGAPPD